MPITSLDHLMRKSTDGSIFSVDWQLTTSSTVAGVAGRWYDFSSFNSGPNAINTYTATNGARTWVNCNSTNAFEIPSGPDVLEQLGETKHIIFGAAMSAVATAVPGLLMLVDLQGYWPTISTNTTTPQTLSGTPTLRYPNGNGLKLYPVVTTATGTGTPNISISYTNQAATSGRSLSQTIPMVASSPVGNLNHTNSGVASTGAGPFLPLQGGDTGVQNVASVTFSTATTGEIALCLARPLLTIPIVTTSNAVERDFVNQFTSLPRVRNSACLVWLFYAGAATAVNTNFYGSLEMVWG